jgi:DNA-binding transcriptional ArsR family regulator
MEISDPRAIRALAHPLRLDLLDLLAAIGPATAARCGRVLGASQASCSFHLRQLARYGYVVDAGSGTDRRERRWRVPDQRPAVRVPASGDAVVRRELHRVVVEREARAVLDHEARRDEEDPPWRDAARLTAGVAVLSAAEIAELERQWLALLEPFLTRQRDGAEFGPDRRPVRLLLAATPLPATTEHSRDEHPGDEHDGTD